LQTGAIAPAHADFGIFTGVGAQVFGNEQFVQELLPQGTILEHDAAEFK
jgi:hypothetical protein